MKKVIALFVMLGVLVLPTVASADVGTVGSDLAPRNTTSRSKVEAAGTNAYFTVDPFYPRVSDGFKDFTLFVLEVAPPANARLEIVNESNDVVLSDDDPVFEETDICTGFPCSWLWDGAGENGLIVPVGTYTIKVYDEDAIDPSVVVAEASVTVTTGFITEHRTELGRQFDRKVERKCKVGRAGTRGLINCFQHGEGGRYGILFYQIPRIPNWTGRWRVNISYRYFVGMPGRITVGKVDDNGPVFVKATKKEKVWVKRVHWTLEVRI